MGDLGTFVRFPLSILADFRLLKNPGRKTWHVPNKLKKWQDDCQISPKKMEKMHINF